MARKKFRFMICKCAGHLGPVTKGKGFNASACECYDNVTDKHLLDAEILFVRKR